MPIWSHPWIAAALSPEGVRLPPEVPVGVRWTASLVGEMSDTELEAWGAFVRTGWVTEALRLRLADGAVVVRVWSEGVLCGTCVVRPRGSDGLWLLETLVAKPRGAGWGAATMHAAVRTVWDRGGTSIGFVWEMPFGGLLRAWWRGWMGAAVSVERGWAWRTTVAAAECGFCPNTKAWLPARPPPVMPVVVSAEDGGWTVVVSDSGLLDGWGHVLAVSAREGVDWERVAAVGGWRDLWYAGAVAPAEGYAGATVPAEGWRWTGEVVVRAILNRAGRPAPSATAWITAEVSSG
jgi:hypothetical protein